MDDAIKLRILGDFDPFSREARCSSYEIEVAGDTYLIDCGAPIFKQLGGHRLKEIRGLFISHCHNDHIRWFTDLAIFHRYAPDVNHKLSLFTTENINNELKKTSSAALSNTLSNCRKKVIGVKYEDYIDFNEIGPRPLYKITSHDEGNGRFKLCVVDRKNQIIGPEQAKIVINPNIDKARMLFLDPPSGEWVDPELFYTFSDNTFYEENQNILAGKNGYTIEVIKAPVWHGTPGVGIKIKSGNDNLIFSSDTVNDKDLWQNLYEEKLEQNFTEISREAFIASAIIYGDINNYIERVWSKKRFQEAISAFNNAAVVHDIAINNSIVHTDYESLDRTLLDRKRTIFVHSPDRITSEWALSATDKEFIVRDNLFLEKVGGQLFPLNANIYHREKGHFFVGYKNAKGKYTVYEKDGKLSLSNAYNFDGRPYFKVDLYEDIGGRYYEKLDDENSSYRVRKDGRVELIRRTESGSRGTLLGKGERERLLR